MKKFYFLSFVLLFMSFSVCSQTSITLKRGHLKSFALHQSSASKGMSASISTETRYRPGETVDINFVLDYKANAPFEYGDSVALTFPAGFTVIGSSTDPIVVPNEFGQEPEALNPVDGQTISWGDNDNNYGGIRVGQHPFVVTVKIDGTVSGTQNIKYHVSGDEYPQSPGDVHDVDGVVSIMEISNAPDLYAGAAGFVHEYYSLPLDQANFNPAGKIGNLGGELTEDVNMTLSATGGYTKTQTMTDDLNTYEESVLNFDTFVASNLGIHTFTYTVNYDDDADVSNNTFSKDIDISHELKCNNGIKEGFVGMNLKGGEIGNVFTVNAQDTLTSIKWKMKGVSGDAIYAIVRKFDAEPGDELGRSVIVVNNGRTDYYQADMQNALVLPPGNYFIGLVESDKGSCGLEYTSTPYIDGKAWGFDGNQWQHIAIWGGGFARMFNIVAVFDDIEPVLNDIKMVSLDFRDIEAQGTLNIVGTIQNKSTEKPLTSYDVVYSIDGGVKSAVCKVSDINIGLNEIHQFTHNIPADLLVGTHTIEVTISNPNGNADVDDADNKMSKDVWVIHEAYPQMIVAEEITGVRCPYCVWGLYGMEYAELQNPDNFIGIAIHSSGMGTDPMTITEYDDSFTNAFGYGQPNVALNRTELVHPKDLPQEGTTEDGTDVMARMKNHLPLAKVSVNNIQYNDATREVTFQASATFATDLTGTNYRFVPVITEDNVKGNTSDYDQANAMSGKSTPFVTPITNIDFQNGPFTMPASAMIYKHVARALIAGWEGQENSIPTDITYNVPITYDFSYTIPEEYNENEIYIVIMLRDVETGKIINATKNNIANTTTNNTDIDYMNVDIYPNPTTGLVYIDGGENANISIYDMLGQIVYSDKKTSNRKVIDVSSYNSGSYIVKIIKNNKIMIQKLILKK